MPFLQLPQGWQIIHGTSHQHDRGTQDSFPHRGTGPASQDLQVHPLPHHQRFKQVSRQRVYPVFLCQPAAMSVGRDKRASGSGHRLLSGLKQPSDPDGEARPGPGPGDQDSEQGQNHRHGGHQAQPHFQVWSLALLYPDSFLHSRMIVKNMLLNMHKIETY